jgi:hypothetical protein
VNICIYVHIKVFEYKYVYTYLSGGFFDAVQHINRYKREVEHSGAFLERYAYMYVCMFKHKRIYILFFSLILFKHIFIDIYVYM